MNLLLFPSLPPPPLLRLLSAIPLLIRELKSLDTGNIAVAFPDEGAWKRFHCDLSQWPTITCIKKRDGEKRVVSIKEGKVASLALNIALHPILGAHFDHML